ncbi:MAG: cytochrome c [Crocinitomicaceae bacterium]|nr:cytochrome c [Crocinitomicaceae bacterium]MDG1658056.1 cytochrome c [Crocinitomicaceae bacterium]MDG2441355.1 cytochrome c [Crocinitomicaceae bacterium]
MNRLLIISFTSLLITGAITSFSWRSSVPQIKKVDVSIISVEEALFRLGDEKLNHSITEIDLEKAKIGQDLIYFGRTVRDGKKSKRISSYFVCTDCHNMSKEFEDITSQDPSERLVYAKKNGLEFLPGSTLWGIYNRTSFYNDDYVRKYGDLVDDARNSLENSTQLCAKYCSSGRNLEDWELEGIMHYFKKNQLMIKDLNLSEDNRSLLASYQNLSDPERTKLISAIKAEYVEGYAATFLETMPRDKRKYGEGGDVENGKTIYEKSCMYCHENKRVTYLHLDQGKLSGKMFWRNIKSYNDRSLYQIIRHGTYSKAGRKQYMPHYTEEKMSDAQLNDLVAYIKLIAKKK